MKKDTPDPHRMTWPGDAEDEPKRRHERELAFAAAEKKRRAAEAAARESAKPSPDKNKE